MCRIGQYRPRTARVDLPFPSPRGPAARPARATAPGADPVTSSQDQPVQRRRRRPYLSMVLLATVVLLWATGCMERLFYYPEAGPTTPPPELAGAESVWLGLWLAVVNFRSLFGFTLSSGLIERESPRRGAIVD